MSTFATEDLVAPSVRDFVEKSRAKYLFSDSSIASLATSDLLALIARHMPDALDMTDGSDCNGDVRIDHAQDVIEQARDQLLLNGHKFTREDQDAMHFLSWPLTPEESAAEAARLAAESLETELRLKAWSAHQGAVEKIVRTLSRGSQLDVHESLQGLTIKVGGQGSSANSWDGQRILELKEAIEQATGNDTRLTYVCREPGHREFQFEKRPAWGLYDIQVSNNPRLWELLHQTFADPDSDVHSIEVWDKRPSVQISGFHCALYDLFERPSHCLWDALSESVVPANSSAPGNVPITQDVVCSSESAELSPPTPAPLYIRLMRVFRVSTSSH